MSATDSPGAAMLPNSPTKSWDDQEMVERDGREDYGRPSAGFDLNEAVTKTDEGEQDDSDSRPEEVDKEEQLEQQRSPLLEDSKRSPSPEKTASPVAGLSPSSPRRTSVSPDSRRPGSSSGRRSPSPVSPDHIQPSSPVSPDHIRPSSPVSPDLIRPSPQESPSPQRRSPGRRGSPSPSRGRSPRRRYSPPRESGRRHYERERSMSPGDTGRRRRQRERSLSRSPVGRSGRALSPYRRERSGRSRSRSPPPRDSRRSPRSRYSPHGFYSPKRRGSPRFQSGRTHSRSRRPWSPPPNRSTGVGNPGNNLFIAGFSFDTTERDLEKKFSRYGHVTDVRIVRDKRSGDSRGFGFLTLERDEDADAAIRGLDQTEWNGRVVLVEKAKTPTRY